MKIQSNKDKFSTKMGIPAIRKDLPHLKEMNADLQLMKEQLRKITERGMEMARQKERRINSARENNSMFVHSINPALKWQKKYDWGKAKQEDTTTNSNNVQIRTQTSLSQIPHVSTSQIAQPQDIKPNNEFKGDQRIVCLNKRVEQLESLLQQQRNINDNIKKELDEETIINKQQKKSIEDLEKQLADEKKKVQTLRTEIERSNMSTLQSSLDSFDLALKTQLREITELKEQLQASQDELTKEREEKEELKQKNEQLSAELKLIEVKAAASLRSNQSKWDIQLSDRNNELQTIKRTLETLQGKYKVSVREIKQKDEFIMNYLVARCKQQDKEAVKSVLEQYQLKFKGDWTYQNLIKEQQTIVELNKELAALKK